MAPEDESAATAAHQRGDSAQQSTAGGRVKAAAVVERSVAVSRTAMKDSDASSVMASESNVGGGASPDEDHYMAKLTAGGQDAELSSQLLGVKRPKARKTRWQNRYVKLLVIGDSGLGKTTLVRCLLAVPGQPLKLHDGSSTCFEEFNKDPSKFLSSVEWDDEEDHVHWTYQIQDTPGYGDDLDLNKNIDRIKKYLLEQNDTWNRNESHARRENVDKFVDPRVDLCIFCLAPHRVRNIDLLFMHEVSKLVPILPVVTKADTMTVKESITYRRELAQKLQNAQAPTNVFLFSKETLDTCGVSQDSLVEIAATRPPYLVVCSNTNNEEKMQGESPEMWPERRYIWGTSEAMNPEHSDLLLLRRLLLQEGVEEIAESKAARYEEWRTGHMSELRIFRKFGRAVLTSLLMAAVVTGLTYAFRHEKVQEVAIKTKDAVQEGLEESVKGAKENFGPAVDKVKKEAVGAKDAVKGKVDELDDDSVIRKLPGVPDQKPARKKLFGIF